MRMKTATKCFGQWEFYGSVRFILCDRHALRHQVSLHIVLRFLSGLRIGQRLLVSLDGAEARRWLAGAPGLQAVGASHAEFFREVWRELSRFLRRMRRQSQPVVEVRS